tara:strand:+ start:735 stop:995 length:261 start_codon:yes stop_codon:yes gene_type:complete
MNQKDLDESIIDLVKKINNNDNQNIKKSSDNKIAKVILLLPIILFLVFFFKINPNQNILNLLMWLSFSGALIFISIIFNLLLNRRS